MSHGGALPCGEAQRYYHCDFVRMLSLAQHCGCLVNVEHNKRENAHVLLSNSGWPPMRSSP